MQANCQAVEDDHATVVERNAKWGEYLFDRAAGSSIYRGDIALRSGWQVNAVGRNQLDMYLHKCDCSIEAGEPEVTEFLNVAHAFIFCQFVIV